MTRSSGLIASPKVLARGLLDWYVSERRDLPWRRSRDPYRVWVSEIMLQQTQAAVVSPYYLRFLKRFPTVDRLAKAELSEVLQLWSGLGYYRRARSLHAAAKTVATSGAFPSTLEGLRALPGFGPYTSAAVGSIAFGLAEAAIDGNAVRVYARLLGLRAPRVQAEPRLRAWARPLMQIGPAGDLNQAVMDLGQLVCTVRDPSCQTCPWRQPCRARREGATGEIPLRAVAQRRRELIEPAARVQRGKTLLLGRRQEHGLFGGLWELPGGTLSPPTRRAKNLGRQAAKATPVALRKALRETLQQELGLEATIGAELASVDRTLTHLQLKLIAFDASASGQPRVSPAGRYVEARFVPLDELDRLGISTASRKLLTALGLW